MVTIKKHKLVFGVDYENSLYTILIRVHEPSLGILYCNYIVPQQTPVSLFRRLYRDSRDKVLQIRENEDRANEVS